MADKQTALEIAALGRLCGITPEYRDNFGRRRATSAATCRALLTAMGVPCETSNERRQSLAELKARRTDRLLPPAAVALVRNCRLSLNLWSPSPAGPGRLELAGELVDEAGERLSWEAAFPVPVSPKAAKVDGGYCQGVSAPLPPGLPPGYYRLNLTVKTTHREETAAALLAVSPGQAYLPEALERGGRFWGFNLPLYAVSSGRNWGMGDFADLRELTSLAGELGAAFVGVNPLHAREPRADGDPSPYAPTSRLFLNFLYINPEAVPELPAAPEAQTLLAGPDFQAHLRRLRKAPLMNYPEVYRLKRQILELLFAAFTEGHGLPEAPRTPRGQEFARFVAQGGESLKNFSLYQALADHQGKTDWRRWPQPLQDPDSPAVAAFAQEQAREIYFQQYLQWLAAGQRQEVWAEAQRNGLPFTLYQDLALGTAAGGFETWGYPGLFASGASMGAPPDAFNPRGQDWGLPPLIPRYLEESGHRLFVETLRANLPPGGIVRLDHVMGLFRLFCIPAGMEPAAGAYVRYPARELLGLLTLESHRRRTLIIGEDLGTVAPRIRRELARARIFSYRVFYFERTSGNRFTPPEDYPHLALAAATTHDLPTLAGYWEGRDIQLKEHMHLYPRPRMAEQDAASREQDRLLLVEALKNRGWLSPDFVPQPQPCPEDVRRGVLAYLGESRAALLEVRLEDILGLTAQQNLPGTTDQHPNWRQKIFPPLEDLRRDPQVAQLAAILGQARGSAG